MSTAGREMDTSKDVYPYLAYVMLFKLVIFLFEGFLDFRQYAKFQDMEVPADIRGFVKKKVFQDSQAYNKDMKKFSILKKTVDFIWEMITLYYLVLAFIWEFESAIAWIGLDPTNEIYKSFFTFLCLYLISTVMSLPWSLYENFVIKQKHGFNTMTLKLFITDMIKSTIIVMVLMAVIIPLIVKIIEWGGEHFYLYLFAFVVCFTFIMMWIMPNFIMPLFNKYEDVEEGDLKTKIYSLADKLHFPLKKLFVVDHSQRSNHSNAYFFGFGSNKRIVLFDNLLKHLETDEIVAVVGHELGHWSMYHNLLNMIISFSSLFVTFYVFSFVIQRDDILIDFGFTKHYNIVALLVFMEIYSPVDYIQNLVRTFLTRVFEFQADRFANDLGYKKDLMKGLIRLHIKNKANLNPDPLYATYHFSHPELVERLRALGDFHDIITIEELDKKEEEIKKQEAAEKAKSEEEKLLKESDQAEETPSEKEKED